MLQPDTPKENGTGVLTPAPTSEIASDQFELKKEGDKVIFTSKEDLLAEDSQSETGDDPGKTPGSDLPAVPLKFARRFEGKTTAQLIELMYEKEQHIGRLGNDLGKERDRNKPKGSETLKADRDTLYKSIDELEARLDDMDSVNDPEDYQKAKTDLANKRKELRKIQDDLQETLIRETHSSGPLAQVNETLAAQIRETYKADYGVNFTDAQWKEIVDEAMLTAGEDTLTEDDVESALVRTMGAERYRKMLLGQGKLKAREEIARANDKVVKQIGGEDNSGIHSYDLNSMDDAKLLKLSNDPKTPYSVKQEIFRINRQRMNQRRNKK